MKKPREKVTGVYLFKSHRDKLQVIIFYNNRRLFERTIDLPLEYSQLFFQVGGRMSDHKLQVIDSYMFKHSIWRVLQIAKRELENPFLHPFKASREPWLVFDGIANHDISKYFPELNDKEWLENAVTLRELMK